MENIEHYKPIKIVIGGQYGSESKGLMTAQAVLESDAEICVRTGSINAGHTVFFRGGRYVNQLIPVGWVNPRTKLVLGAGTYIEIGILEKEIKMINEAINDGSDVTDRLFIDKQCGVHNDAHKAKEVEMNLHGKMGSTGKGVMTAIIDKMERSRDYKLFSQSSENTAKYNVVDTVVMLNKAYKNKEQIVLEGTQGALLDFHLGHYPYVTSRQTNAIAWMTEAGLPVNFLTEIYSVIRTMPIRVAGNSGPMGDNEVRWNELARIVNEKLVSAGKSPIVDNGAIASFEHAEELVMRENGITRHPVYMTPKEKELNSQFISDYHNLALEKLSDETREELGKFFEITTVTKKLRRIAELDKKELAYSNLINNPDTLCVNFLNYKFPSCYNARTNEELRASAEWKQIDAYLEEMANEFEVSIQYVNCAPDCVIKLEQMYGTKFI